MQKIDINLKPSFLFLSLLIVMWISSNLVIFTLDIHFVWKVFLWVGILFYASRLFNQHGILQSEKSITSLQLRGQQWLANKRPVILLGDSAVTRFVSILRLQCPLTRKITVSVIFPDSPQGIAYRQLMMLLRTVDILAHEK